AETTASNSDINSSSTPGWMGFDTLKRIIVAKKDVVDISFFEEDALQLEELAREKGVRAIVDCGVAPGLSNMILGHHASKSKLNSFRCLVGGLPFERIPPFEYKAPFSPMDVIAEYTRPARFVKNGQMVVMDALSDEEIVAFEGLGDLEAFNTDGLRSILHTMHVPNMIEKTLRYPGHAKLMRSFREAGFFSEDEITLPGGSFRAIDLTSKILFDNWKQGEDQKEFTVMRIELHGEKESVQYDIFDQGNSIEKVSSMARLTGYTCTSTMRFLVNSTIPAGLWPPELLASKFPILDFVLEYLQNQGIEIKKHTRLTP
ncbi:MAG: saccharopine dehydrogenase C-terminal domain-containing protein, partial [Vicingaceae bacterium]